MKKIIRCLEESYQEGTQPRCCMDEKTGSTIRNTGSRWKKIGDDGRRICSLGIVRTHS